MARSVSLRPDPTRPARPRISPRRTSKLTSRGRRPRVRPSTRSATGPVVRGACSTASSTPSPTISRTISSIDASSASRSPTIAAVAEHGDAMTQPANLLEPVADVEDRGARRGEAAQVRERLRDLGIGQRRGRLVEDQHAARVRQRRRQRDELLLADAEPASRQVGIEGVEADGPQRRRRLRAQGRGRDEPGATRQVGQEQVLGDAERRDQVRLLEHDLDAGALRLATRPRSIRLAGQVHRAAVGRDQAAHDLRPASTCRRRWRPSARAPRRRARSRSTSASTGAA